jgi:hypothetical protein
MTRPLTTSLVAVLSLSTACAGLEPSTSVRLDPRLNVGNMGAHNSYELRNGLIARAEANAPVADSSPRQRRPVTPILFWLGIGLTVVGGVGTIGTASAGYATQRQISSGFAGNISADELRELNKRGDALNKASIASAAITVIGAILALTTYGVDYTRCGPLAPKRRRVTAPPGRCADEDSK